MSYKQATKFSRPAKKKQAQYLGLNPLGPNKRRRYPWLGRSWYEPGRDEERAVFIRAWQEETERLLEENPNLEIV